VLTGRGVVSPLGVGIEQHWEALRAGRCAIAPVARLAALGLPAPRGAEVGPDLLEPHLGRLPRKQQKLYSRATLLGMLGAALAMDDAGLPANGQDPTRFGVLLGVNVLSWDLAAMTAYLGASESREQPGALDMALANTFCMRNINPLDYSLKTLPNLAAGHLAIAHNARGICRAMTEGPVGGAHAIGQAYRMIAEGDLDVALAGGADAQLEELLFATLFGLGLFASDDARAPGSIAAEGSGILVLEAAEHAEARGAPVHGQVCGFCAAAGEGRLTPHGDVDRLADRLARVIGAVRDEVGADPDFVSLHGDGAPVHDRAEQLALRQALGPRVERTPMLSMKLAHGDLGAASSPVEVLACSAAMRHGIIPSAISTASTTCRSPLKRALVISLGLFGECAALMLEVRHAG
jgi:3-oxoacyl-(acyl-carrier-protein) synthase